MSINQFDAKPTSENEKHECALKIESRISAIANNFDKQDASRQAIPMKSLLFK